MNDLNSAIGYLRLFERAILNEIDSSTTSLASRSRFESIIGSPHPLGPLSLECVKHNAMSGWIDAFRKEFQRTKSDSGNCNEPPASQLSLGRHLGLMKFRTGLCGTVKCTRLYDN